LKAAQVNSSQDLILKNPSQKNGLVEWIKVKALSSSPSTGGKKKQSKTKPLKVELRYESAIPLLGNRPEGTPASTAAQLTTPRCGISQAPDN
jgi:hypothetical protein